MLTAGKINKKGGKSGKKVYLDLSARDVAVKVFTNEGASNGKLKCQICKEELVYSKKSGYTNHFIHIQSQHPTVSMVHKLALILSIMTCSNVFGSIDLLWSVSTSLH